VKDQPVIISGLVTILVPLIVAAAAKWGLSFDPSAVSSVLMTTLVAVAGLMVKWTHGKVAPLAKMRRLSPDAHAAYMAALKRQS